MPDVIKSPIVQHGALHFIILVFCIVVAAMNVPNEYVYGYAAASVTTANLLTFCARLWHIHDREMRSIR